MAHTIEQETETQTSSIRSREHLLHGLAEAAELEHNLLCSYLYAAFSLKRSTAEDLTAEELVAVTRWRKSIFGVCMEEMSHLAQVANLMVALGSRPHFDRPNLPVPPGYHPAGIHVSLRPFDLETLDHFIFLERPMDVPLVGSPPDQPVADPGRGSEWSVLMPSAPDYATIGEFYGLLLEGLAHLSATLGERTLFLGPADCQMRADEIGIDELSVVTDLESARRAIHLIIVQGEGASTADESSHYQHFLKIRLEFEGLRAQRQAFVPARSVASNPVMRRPTCDERVHITAQPAAAVLDAANAVYSLMLRLLVELYETPTTRAAHRGALLKGATGLMKVLGELSNELTQLPAGVDTDTHAGVTFAMLRSTEGSAPGVDPLTVLGERLQDFSSELPRLELAIESAARVKALVDAIRESLLRVSRR